MTWIFVALLSPICYGLANIFDSHITNRLFKKTWLLVFYSACVNMGFMLIPAALFPPSIPDLSLVPVIIVIGLIELVYPYPYYRALQHADTSVVSSLFELGKIFVPLLAFLTVGEKLSFQQYMGFYFIIMCSTLLTLNGERGKLRLNAAFGYMAVCSFMIAVEAVLYKYLFVQVDWSTGFVWPTVVTFILTMMLLLHPKIRSQVKAQWPEARHAFPLFAAEESLTFLGSATSTYAISLVSVTMQQGISALQPLFVLGYGLFVKNFFPRFSHEGLTTAALFRKSLLFLMIIGGVVLTVYSGT